MNKYYYEQTYSWMSKIGLRIIITQKHIDHIKPEQKRKEEKEKFMIDNKDCLCRHGNLNLIAERLGEYVPTIVYNNTKNIINDDLNRKI